MIFAYSRGWLIIFIKGEWKYVDTGNKLEKNRPCKRCNRSPTKEGYDACTGYISNLLSFCCGHGIIGEEIRRI